MEVWEEPPEIMGAVCQIMRTANRLIIGHGATDCKRAGEV
jgi:hypothetical protein